MPRPGGVGAGHPAHLLGALASGVLLLVVFPRWDLGWLAWVSLVPLLLAIRHANPGGAFQLGLASGIVAYGGIMEWIRIFGIPAWIMLSVGMAAFLGAWAAGTVVLARRYGPAAWPWAAALTWVAVEVVRSIGPLGFPWALLGLTQYQTPAVLRVAAVGGVFGVGALIVLVNAGIAGLLAGPKAPAGLAVAAAAAVLATAGLWPSPPRGDPRIVAAVQPNVPPQVRADAAASAEIIALLLRQTDEARAANAEIIVYPETAVPPTVGVEAAAQLAQRAGGAVVVTGMLFPGPMNGIVVLDGQGRELGRYAKRRPVPFGEAGIRPGTVSTPVSTPAGVLGLGICYESAFTDLMRPAAAGGAGLLAILTNDGWFGVTAGPAQHAAHSVLRAAETGRSLVRAANTGMSMLIGPEGRIVATQPLDTPGVLTASLPVGGPLTPYVRWGWLIAPLAVVCWGLATVPVAWRTVRDRPAAARRLALAVLLPGAVWSVAASADRGVTVVTAAAAVLLLCALLARGRLLSLHGVPRSAIVSLVVTGVLVAAMRAAYARYGLTMRIGPEDGGWMPWMVPHLLAGFATETWLRGAVFDAAQDLGGWRLAVLLPTFLGIALHAGRPQEIIFWHLFTGVGFGMIRLWAKDAVGLGPARGIGDAVVMGLGNLR